MVGDAPRAKEVGHPSRRLAAVADGRQIGLLFDQGANAVGGQTGPGVDRAAAGAEAHHAQRGLVTSKVASGSGSAGRVLPGSGRGSSEEI